MGKSCIKKVKKELSCSNKNKKQKIILCVLIIASCLFLAAAFICHFAKASYNTSEDIIGQADGTTSIFVHSGFPFDSFYVYLFIGLLCGLLSIFIMLKVRRKK